ncbi:hypothetical protein DTL21_27985 [Bremerella cremea]|uniref:Uncharacterized protein n=1 Tax=Blastopirellula marina TaxID=124 RepID=A0A2S8F8F5_9BACT|nr:MULTISPECIES: hypothetical protein [Pirellulaceae]PQO28446.1 hypothetical protein C5Y83_27940 [Blastopirellula marina]RCS41815.1 hypothetical protein DTL21_27985 [Bremerella cremea]
MPRCVRFGLTILFVFGACSLLPAADDLEKQLLKQGPRVMDALKERGYQNVGVLKFRIKKGNEASVDQVGSLNMRLTKKLELALVVANDTRDPIGLIANASQIASEIEGASHLSEEGREKLFSQEYPLAWGDEKVVPDAFVTGVALISSDLRTMAVGILGFDSTSEALFPIVKFQVALDLEDLLDSGESFTVRGVFDDGSLSMSQEERKDKATEEALTTSLEVKQETVNESSPAKSKIHPLASSDAAVLLEIRYDNEVQEIEFRDGAAFVPEPQQGQKVFLIVRRKSSDKRLGLVLKVNGENTLGRQTVADSQAKAWVLEPDRKEWGFQGYYDTSANTMEPFKVLSQTESKAKEIDYGEFAGSISISLFPEQKVKPKVSTELLTDEGEDFQILTQGDFPSEKPSNLGALKQQLAQNVTRGLISNGEAVGQTLGTAKFVKDTIPIMTATVKYYSPQDLPE